MSKDHAVGICNVNFINTLQLQYESNVEWITTHTTKNFQRVSNELVDVKLKLEENDIELESVNYPYGLVPAVPTAAKVDFSNSEDPTNTQYTVHGGAQIMTGPGRVKALHIHRNRPYAEIPDFSTSPSTYEQLTMTIGLYVVSKASLHGWLLSSRDVGWDHDHKLSSGVVKNGIHALI